MSPPEEWPGAEYETRETIALPKWWPFQFSQSEQGVDISVDIPIEARSSQRPWVARITGLSGRFGLEREFLKSYARDDVEQIYTLLEGATYEIASYASVELGPAWEHGLAFDLVRNFAKIRDNALVAVTPMQVLEEADPDPTPVQILRLQEKAPWRELRRPGPEDFPWVAEVRGLGRPAPIGFILDPIENRRIYRLHPNRIYEVRTTPPDESRRLVQVEDGVIVDLTQDMAWTRLQAGLCER